MRSSLIKAQARLDLLIENLAENKAELTEVRKGLTIAEDSLTVLQTAAKISQESLGRHLSLIVTQAVQAVIQKPYEFVCEFVERRGSTEADMYLIKGGHKFDILAGTGGGLADVVSFSLKVAFLLLSNVSRTLILDEVSRHINDPGQRERFAEVVRKLADEFKIQIVINSTVTELLAIADSIVTVRQRDDVSYI